MAPSRAERESLDARDALAAISGSAVAPRQEEGTAEPGNAFRRVPVEVRLDRGGTVDAWSYEMGDSKARRRPIESGDFIHHRRLKDQRPVRD